MLENYKTMPLNTPAMVAVAALWALVPLLGMTGRWLPGLFVAVALMVLLATLGSAHRPCRQT